jgi:polysaccharide biosynthesis/export protein
VQTMQLSRRRLTIGLAAVLVATTLSRAAVGGDAILQPMPIAPVFYPAPVLYPAPGQGLGPAAPCPICAVDGSQCCVRDQCGRSREACWEDARFIAWQAYAQGEYVGHARTAHVPEYRLRVDDQLDMLYRITRDETRLPYRLNVGDSVRVELLADPELNRELMVQPDGMITVPLLGQVHAAGRTVTQLRDVLDELYKKYYKLPSITVTPIKVNTQLDDLRNVVDRRYGLGGGQGTNVRVAPDGTISLTAIGYVRAQGLTLNELRQEINERYREKIEGMEIIPVLNTRAPRYCYVLGEVRTPGRFEMIEPTTALQAIAMAGSWNVGANTSQIVVFRRGDDWRLMATMINLEGALRGKKPAPPGEIWLSDSDVIVVPKGRILEADDFINLVFTRGLYGAFPFSSTLTIGKLASI